MLDNEPVSKQDLQRGIAILIGIPLIVLLAIKILEKFNKQVKQTGILALPQYYLIILGLMALSGASYVFFG